ncbi:MAG: tetratricopeptide repeat protein [Planctomycetes bacterium]|nr:tetratricopeptide repeat protein [Planctomycetota bacterium]
MRQGRRIFVVALALLLAHSVRREALAQPASTPPEMLPDAALHDVFFLDVDRGWAVGDRGVIWTTDDGGRHWRLSDSPVNCSLRSIHFVDHQNGWIVGGWTHPYSHRTSGVVLRTENGGRRWTQVSSPTLPTLKQVKFFDRRHGWAVGTPSAMYPAGVFRTEDGGRSWSSFGTDQQNEWLAADFGDVNHGLVVGRGGAAAVVGATSLQPLVKPNTGIRHLRVAHATDHARMQLAGDGGLLIVTDDAGRSWHSPELPLPPQVADKIDFQAFAAVDNICWLAGNPGSCIFRSRDHGRSWEMLRTGKSLPIRAMTFVDAQRGWAVGAFGMILATRDGGETWLNQHTRGSRAAMLGLFAETSEVPLELLARYCGDEGYLGVIESLTRRDVEAASPTIASDEQRLAAGVIAASGSYANTTWRFPLRQAGLKMTAMSIKRGWSVTNGTEGDTALEEYLVMRIRQWRPDVVVTRASNPRQQDPLAQLVNQSVLRATEQAADPSVYADQIRILGLEPWQAKKVCAVADGEGSGPMSIDTSQLATRLGRSIKEHASQGYTMLHDRWSPTLRRRGIELLSSQIPTAAARRDLFSGVAISYASDARRAEGHPQATSLASLRLVTQKQRVIETLLTRATSDADNLAGWSAQIDDLTRELTPQAGGDILYQLAQRYRDIGRYELACESLQQLVRKYPTHSLSEAAVTWCIEYLSSEEVATAFGMQPAVGSHLVQQVSRAEAFNAALPPNQTRRIEVTRYDSRAQRAGFDAPSDATDPLERLLFQVDNLQQLRPALFADPRLRFAIASANRKQGRLHAANRLYQQVAGSQPFDGWRRTAHGELWLTSRKGHPPKPLLPCPSVPEKPFLDGKFDEEFWASAVQAELKSQLGDDADWPSTIRLARDDEYLYLSIQCRKIKGLTYAAADEERGRDPDLSTQDRVELLLDTNRDYTSYVKLTVDHRGWTGETAWGDARWNPEWFVATETSEDTWSIEAAIPFAGLGHEHIAEGDVWACGVQRIVPGVGFQSWTQPASVSGSPEGFGFLSFD